MSRMKWRNENEGWPNERKMRSKVDYLASLVCDSASIEQTLRAKLEHYVNGMILVSTMCMLLQLFISSSYSGVSYLLSTDN